MNKLLNEIKRFKKLTNLNESEPIRGIRDFVFNPLTGFGGKIGYGYVKGKKITGAHWPDHDTHLHITFDDKQVAMEVIDKGNSMGLTVGENPYAKNDPTGRMEFVHKKKKTGELVSQHYFNFDDVPFNRSGSYDYGGRAVVGRAVDISGPMSKMLEFCKWVLSTYETKGYSPVPSLDLTSKKTEDNNLPTTLKPQSVGSKNEPEKNILSKSTETKPNSIGGGSSELTTSPVGDENALLEKIKKSEYLGMKVEDLLRIKNNPQELFFFLMKMMDNL